MSKKDKKKKEKVELTATKASPAVASKKASDLKSSLDSLFKEAKETKEKNEKKKEKELKKEKIRMRKEFEAINEMKATHGDPIGYDEESGMKIYREDQLNIGKGGNTPLCPFDCDCCF
ncbi:hypothetical protein WA556_002349 [Blastocystis sp. ATCC 50177/Nand II]